ncbi:nitrite reductase small subunit NirD [Sciscionella sediminilitoris]|uniref:nitrite reductase small subunit NirD n=1 Tax=Sciscionella sediminilitoris TaxID=1445613 RepID=UPI00068FB3AF|nr:nitrite reductase small subunit NirD [Sciscionella sp. SE31]
MNWIRICRAAELPDGGGRAALLPGQRSIAVFRYRETEYYALSNVDPFSGAPVLAHGILGDAGGEPFVASPIYKQRFSLRTGVCLDEEEVVVATFGVRIRDDLLYVGESALSPLDAVP